jgi:hypothetical protein
MLSSRQSIAKANNNFEHLKNNFMQSTKSSVNKKGLKLSRVSSARGTINEETKRNLASAGMYKTNFSGVNRNS